MSAFGKSIVGLVLTSSVVGMCGVTAASPEESVVAALELMTDLAPDTKIVTLVVDVTAGTEFPLHSHGGPGVATLLSGEMDITFPDGSKRHFAPGDVFVETEGMVHGAVVGGSDVRFVWTIVLPDGAEMETPYEG